MPQDQPSKSNILSLVTTPPPEKPSETDPYEIILTLKLLLERLENGELDPANYQHLLVLMVDRHEEKYTIRMTCNNSRSTDLVALMEVAKNNLMANLTGVG